MANDLNYNCFTGRLGADPELNYTPSGAAVANFSIAVGSSWKDKVTGEKKEKTEWIRCVAWNKSAELIGEYMKKGSRILVQGRQETRSWEQDGVKKYMTECIVSQFIFLDSKSDQQGYEKPQEPPGGITPSEVASVVGGTVVDDIPF